MEVSAVTSRSDVAVVATAGASGATQQHAPARRDAQRPSLPAPEPERRVDPSEALSERVRSGIDSTRTSEELWIPAWARVAYAARARRGWFLPAPTDLAGMSDEDPAED